MRNKVSERKVRRGAQKKVNDFARREGFALTFLPKRTLCIGAAGRREEGDHRDIGNSESRSGAQAGKLTIDVLSKEDEKLINIQNERENKKGVNRVVDEGGSQGK